MRCVWAAAIVSILLVSCSKNEATIFPGYVEAEYTRIAAPIAGRLIRLSAVKGHEVKVGDPLFVLESENEQAAVDEAHARVRRDVSLAADLSKGKRQDEIDVLKAQLAAAQANQALAQSDLNRQTALARTGFISSASLENLQTRVKAEAAKVTELQAQLRVAQLASRRDAQAAAEAEVQTAQAQLAQSQWRLSQKAVQAPVMALVDDTLFRVGEWVPAGSPVVSLREADAVKVRFFVPQEKLPQFTVGSAVQIRCDGCQSFAAHVNYVAPSAEFTPPVIYSKDSRAKLVFLVEAKPDSLKVMAPGLPVDVLLDVKP